MILRERAEVTSSLPEVIIPELPESAEQFVGFLAQSGLFTHLAIGTEDKNRTQLYNEETVRKAQAKTEIIGKFLIGSQSGNDTTSNWARKYRTRCSTY